nr:hypothetical protein [Pirellulaceae bacterium]
MSAIRILTHALLLSALLDNALGAEPQVADRPIGYTELQTDLPGGRHANVRTSRAVVIRADGSGRRVLAEELAGEPDAWTQFAGWSPDGKTAVINRGWQDPENARWEEEHKTFRMLPGKWSLDSYLLDMATDQRTTRPPTRPRRDVGTLAACSLFRLMNTRMKRNWKRRTPMTRCRLVPGLRVGLVALVTAFAIGQPADGAVMKTFYVSPAGDDANPGTQEWPLATLGGARDA